VLCAISQAGRRRAATGATEGGGSTAFPVELGAGSADPGVPAGHAWFASAKRWRSQTCVQASGGATAEAAASRLLSDVPQAAAACAVEPRPVAEEAQSCSRGADVPGAPEGRPPPVFAAGKRPFRALDRESLQPPQRRLRRSGSARDLPESVPSQEPAFAWVEAVGAPAVGDAAGEGSTGGLRPAASAALPVAGQDAALRGKPADAAAGSIGSTLGEGSTGGPRPTAATAALPEAGQEAVPRGEPAGAAAGCTLLRQAEVPLPAAALQYGLFSARLPLRPQQVKGEVRAVGHLPAVGQRPVATAARASRSTGSAAAGSSQRGSRRTRRYNEAERRAASPFIAKLMEVADFNSNVTGGSTTFKQMMREARTLAPPGVRPQLAEVLSAFKSNTPGIHGSLLDKIILAWGGDDAGGETRGV